MKEGMPYPRLRGGRIRCDLFAHSCVIFPGRSASAKCVRTGMVLYTTWSTGTHGRPGRGSHREEADLPLLSRQHRLFDHDCGVQLPLAVLPKLAVPRVEHYRPHKTGYSPII